MLETKLITGMDIDLTTYGLGSIKQPTLEQLIELPLDNDMDFLIPFLVIEEYYQSLKDEDLTRLQLLPFVEQLYDAEMHRKLEEEKQERFFDDFIEKKRLHTFSETFLLFIQILFDCKIDDIVIQEFEGSLIILIKDKAVIEDDNFDILVKTVFKMFDIDINSLSVKDSEDEWKEFTGSKKEKEMIEHFKKKEKKRREKEKMHLCDYINFVVNGGKRNYKDVLEWTYFQLIQAYKIDCLKDRRLLEERIFSTGMSDMKSSDITNWQMETKQIIDKSFY